MVAQMDKEGFGGCTVTEECEAACPAGISINNIGRLNRELHQGPVRRRMTLVGNAVQVLRNVGGTARASERGPPPDGDWQARLSKQSQRWAGARSASWSHLRLFPQSRAVMMLRTACYSWHAAHGGRMVDFAGWEMPVQYTSISRSTRPCGGGRPVRHRPTWAASKIPPAPMPAGFWTICSPNDVDEAQAGRDSLFARHQRSGRHSRRRAGLPVRSRFISSWSTPSNRLKIVDWIAHRGGFAYRDDVTTQDVHAGIGGRALETPVAARHADIEVADSRSYD